MIYKGLNRQFKMHSELCDLFEKFYNLSVRPHLNDSLIHSEWKYFTSMFKAATLDLPRVNIYLSILAQQKQRSSLISSTQGEARGKTKDSATKHLESVSSDLIVSPNNRYEPIVNPQRSTPKRLQQKYRKNNQSTDMLFQKVQINIGYQIPTQSSVISQSNNASSAYTAPQLISLPFKHSDQRDIYQKRQSIVKEDIYRSSLKNRSLSYSENSILRHDEKEHIQRSELLSISQRLITLFQSTRMCMA